jgi:hypothetical protein
LIIPVSTPFVPTPRGVVMVPYREIHEEEGRWSAVLPDGHPAAAGNKRQQPGAKRAIRLETGQAAPHIDPGFLKHIFGERSISKEYSCSTPAGSCIALDQLLEGPLVSHLGTANEIILHHISSKARTS